MKTKAFFNFTEKRHFTLPFLAMTMLFLAQFTDTKSAFASEPEEIVIVKGRSLIQEDSSEHMRLDKKHLLQLSSTSSSRIGLLFGVKSSFTYGRFLNRNDLVLLGLGSGSGSDIFSELFAQTVQTKMKFVNVGYRHFFGNSFYLSTGLEYQELSHEGTERSWFSSKHDILNYSRLSLKIWNASLAIGNQWQWQNFTIGVDWLGILAPIASQEADFQNTSKDPEYADAHRERSQHLTRYSEIYLLGLNIGASF